MPSPASTTQSVSEILVRAGALTGEQKARAEQYAREEGSRIEEAAIELGFVEEANLLKILSVHYSTQFVSTAQLAKAAIDKPTIAMIPRRIAEMLGVFPVIFDASSGTLSVVTADPRDDDMLRNVQSVSGARNVKAFVARPRAVVAAIARAHAGDLQAFARLEIEAAGQMHGLLDVRGRTERPRDVRPERAAPAERPKKPAQLPKGRHEAEGHARHGPPTPPPSEPPAASLGSIGPPPMAPAATLAAAVVAPLAPPPDLSGTYSLDELLDLLNVLISLLENA